jgi:hypothetical protein
MIGVAWVLMFIVGFLLSGRHGRLSAAASIVVLLSIPAFLGTLIHYEYSGGGAMYGKVENGRFFLGNRSELVEVAASTYLTSAMLELTALSGHALLFGLGIGGGWRKR